MTHKDLDAWKLSFDLVKEIYLITKKFPKEEIFGISNQMRRASVSIPSNIAEGAARNSKKEFKQFLYISLGSLSELETQILISVELNFITKETDLINRIIEIRKRILGLIKYLSKSDS